MELMQEYNSLFPDYRFINLVGQGSYGDVYCCIRESDGIRVALKIIRNSESKGDGLSVSTLREIMFMRYCQHPNIVRILDIISTNVTLSDRYERLPPLAIVMEYIENDMLGLLKSARMGYSNWLSIDAIRWISYQLFSALSYLHSHNIIHRDLKPANLLITSNCDLKLADFGLSRQIGNVLVSNYTNRVITLWYRPPELILGATHYGPEVDIWSAGCILGELLSGSSLFPNYNNDNEFSQLQLIFRSCGYPDDPTLLDLIKKNGIEFEETFSRSLPQMIVSSARSVKRYQFASIPEEALDLIDSILQTSPSKRPTAAKILQHPFYRGMGHIQFSFPLLSSEGCHNLEVKRRMARISDGHEIAREGDIQLVKNRKALDAWVGEKEVIDLCDLSQSESESPSQPVVPTGLVNSMDLRIEGSENYKDGVSLKKSNGSNGFNPSIPSNGSNGFNPSNPSNPSNGSNGFNPSNGFNGPNPSKDSTDSINSKKSKGPLRPAESTVPGYQTNRSKPVTPMCSTQSIRVKEVSDPLSSSPPKLQDNQTRLPQELKSVKRKKLVIYSSEKSPSSKKPPKDISGKSSSTSKRNGSNSTHTNHKAQNNNRKGKKRTKPLPSAGETASETPAPKRYLTLEEEREKWLTILTEEDKKKEERSARREAMYLSRKKAIEEREYQEQLLQIQIMEGISPSNPESGKSVSKKKGKRDGIVSSPKDTKQEKMPEHKACSVQGTSQLKLKVKVNELIDAIRNTGIGNEVLVS